jgi:Flp pilus assembly protein TadB
MGQHVYRPEPDPSRDDSLADDESGESRKRAAFWIAVSGMGLLAVFLLPLLWALAATIPIVVAAWWIAYQSDWF